MHPSVQKSQVRLFVAKPFWLRSIHTSQMFLPTKAGVAESLAYADYHRAAAFQVILSDGSMPAILMRRRQPAGRTFIPSWMSGPVVSSIEPA